MEKNTQVYGSGNGSFENLNFNGEPLSYDGKVTSGIFYFEHIYHNQMYGLAPFLEEKDLSREEFEKKYPANKRHRCLSSGYWCFKNFKEHPLDISDYLSIKSGLRALQRFIRDVRWRIEDFIETKKASAT